ncbi:uncharacterized protein F54H12.2-like [Pimephales promelas]|uniref:uncharacterized protein F54H12.2-like n=1 Tax=Pimephales promelas TaxID=90988 RepID=UPI0019559E94|nr:uncharacterized protein F54H12.2-like [Pimephales promelas]XP_039525757.1 uncharacterized protein F54H12.2-like [Pimephales promelas]XP_039525759.1 uncharacterized protein F54H12.2-like [Pimephales promelas]
MALLHRMSGECIKSELDLFTVPLTQTVIEKNGYLEVAPLSAISDTAPLEFFIAGNGDDYLDLNNTMLYLRLKITKRNGDAIADPAKVALINYPGATIFSQVDVTLGDRLISQSSSTYPYRCIIESLINYSSHALESLFSAGLFYKDTAGHMDVNDPIGRNLGLLKRSRYTSASKVVELLAPIHSDLFFQEKLLLNGVDVKIRMTRAKDEFCLMRCDDVDYKINIVSASLFVKKVSVSPPVRLGHAQALLSATAKYPIDRVCLKNFSIPAGARVSTQENLFLGTLPKSIIITMVDNDAFTGAYDKNPFAFKHYDLEFLAVYVDGQQFPAKPLQPNFTDGLAVREFYQLAMTTGRHLKNQSLSIDRSDFLDGYTLYAFNLTPDEECGQHISLIKSGNIRLEARFRQPLPNTVNLLIYAVFDSIIEVSNRRQVLVDYY